MYEGPLETFLRKENLKDLNAVIQYCEEKDFTATVINNINPNLTKEELMELERQPPVATIVCPTPFNKGGIDGRGILKIDSNCFAESSPGWKFRKGDTIRNKEGRIGGYCRVRTNRQ